MKNKPPSGAFAQQLAREREKLALLCQADRLRARLIVETARRERERIPPALRYTGEALHAARALPGRLGRLASKVLFGLQLGKVLGLQRLIFR